MSCVNVVGVWLLLIVIVSCIEDAKEMLRRASWVSWWSLHATHIRECWYRCTVWLPPIRSVLPLAILPFLEWLDGDSKSLVLHVFSFHHFNLRTNLRVQKKNLNIFDPSMSHTEILLPKTCSALKIRTAFINPKPWTLSRIVLLKTVLSSICDRD